MSSHLKKLGFSNIKGRAYYPAENSGGFYVSTLERDAYIYWLMERGVERVALEPPTIDYVCDGKGRGYTPDLYVQFYPAANRQSFYIECKYTKDLTPDVIAKHDLVTKEYQRRNEKFVVQTEKDIRVPTFSHRRFLLGARDEPADAEMESEILRLIKEAGPLKVGELLSRLADDRTRQLEIVPQVWRLAGWHRIDVSLATVLGEETVVQINVEPT